MDFEKEYQEFKLLVNKYTKAREIIAGWNPERTGRIRARDAAISWLDGRLEASRLQAEGLRSVTMALQEAQGEPVAPPAEPDLKKTAKSTKKTVAL